MRAVPEAVSAWTARLAEAGVGERPLGGGLGGHGRLRARGQRPRPRGFGGRPRRLRAGDRAGRRSTASWIWERRPEPTSARCTSTPDGSPSRPPRTRPGRTAGWCSASSPASPGPSSGRHGFAVLGRPPSEVLPPITDDDVRAAARAEVCGYWAWASRRPWMWLSPVIADLGLTSMARGRYAVRHGQLLTKSGAIEEARAPDWLIEQLRARRRGEHVVSPRLRTGFIAWRDARATVGVVRQSC